MKGKTMKRLNVFLFGLLLLIGCASTQSIAAAPTCSPSAAAAKYCVTTDGVVHGRDFKLLPNDTSIAGTSASSTFKTPQAYGALVDGVTDDTAAWTALQAALVDNDMIFCDGGTTITNTRIFIIKNNVTMFGSCEIKAKSTIIATDGLIVVGKNSAGALIATNGFLLSGITLNGNNVSNSAFYSYDVDNIKISHVTTKNTAGFGSIRLYLADNSSVEYATVSHALGDYGDGIYCGGCTNFTAAYNAVTDFQRIAIVTESEAGTLSISPTIVHNKGSAVVTNTGGQINGGIWLENTHSGIVTGNTMDTTSICITIATGSGGGGRFFLTDNTSIANGTGLKLAAATTDDIFVDGFVDRPATSPTFWQGVQISGVQNLYLKHLDLKGVTYPSGSNNSGAIVFEPFNNYTFKNIVVEDSVLGTMTYAGEIGDIRLLYTDNNQGTNVGVSLVNLTLKNLQGSWRYMTQGYTPVNYVIENATITWGHATLSRPFNAQTSMRVINSDFTQVTSGVGDDRGPEVTTGFAYFENVTFHNMTHTISNAGGSTYPKQTYVNCHFVDGTVIWPDGQVDLTFIGGNWTGYHATRGSLWGNGSNFTFNLVIRDMVFTLAADVTPVQFRSFQPTTFVYSGVKFNTTTFTTMAVTSDNVGGITTTDNAPFYSALTYCKGDTATLQNGLNPLRVAANDWGLSRTSGGAETINIRCDLPVPARTTSGKGWKLTAFSVSQQITIQALTSNTFNALSTTTYVNNVANAVSAYGGSITISMPTATQANPYLTVGTVGTPAFMNTAGTSIGLDFTVVLQNTGVYTLYGITTTWTEVAP